MKHVVRVACAYEFTVVSRCCNHHVFRLELFIYKPQNEWVTTDTFEHHFFDLINLNEYYILIMFVISQTTVSQDFATKFVH